MAGPTASEKPFTTSQPSIKNGASEKNFLDRSDRDTIYDVWSTSSCRGSSWSSALRGLLMLSQSGGYVWTPAARLLFSEVSRATSSPVSRVLPSEWYSAMSKRSASYELLLRTKASGFLFQVHPITIVNTRLRLLSWRNKLLHTYSGQIACTKVYSITAKHVYGTFPQYLNQVYCTSAFLFSFWWICFQKYLHVNSVPSFRPSFSPNHLNINTPKNPPITKPSLSTFPHPPISLMIPPHLPILQYKPETIPLSSRTAMARDRDSLTINLSPHYCIAHVGPKPSVSSFLDVFLHVFHSTCFAMINLSGS
ncbi:hypothetical protein P154DRAFT_155059 [Amniculicola lignicola CBS 123094]|uniref:Uncharacterized protein n=1 Tax=Amniculicola lignicola CBS 123094 TaxID=1392246 RepID=A0A6A5WMB3_9PLEO|nr:hypothetical protein P154DRAFT_155059 [Amniculicola lignicola CBS 123094]